MNLFRAVGLAIVAAVVVLFLVDPWWIGALMLGAIGVVIAAVMVLARLASLPEEENRTGQ